MWISIQDLTRQPQLRNLSLGDLEGFLFSLSAHVAGDEILVGRFKLDHGVESAHRTLRNVGNILPAQASLILWAERIDIGLLREQKTVIDLPADQPQRRFDVAKEGFHKGCFPASAFPSNPIDFVLLDLEIDPIDRFHHLSGPENVEYVEGFQLFSPKYRLVHNRLTLPPPVGYGPWGRGTRWCLRIPDTRRRKGRR